MSSKGETKEIQSHAVPDESESFAANPKADVDDTASSKVPNTIDFASIPLKPSAKTLDTEPAQTVEEEPAPAPAATGGGVTGFIRSILGGGGQKESPHAETTVESTDATPEVTYETELKGGTGAQVATAPGHSAVPDTLQNSPKPVGTATTTFEEPVSEFAPALASIAGEPEPADPTRAYAPALGSLTGDSPVASSSPGYVSSAIHYATDTVKHAVGLDKDTATSPKATETGTGVTPTSTEIGTGVTPAVKSSPNALTIDDLPKAGRVHPHEDGSIDVSKGGLTSLAARQAEGLAPASTTAPTTGSSTKTPVVFEDENTEVITAKDLPKSGTVETSEDGCAEIKQTPTPGLFAAAVGTVLGGAEYVKETVSHLVTGDQAGDTSEQIKALDSKDELPPLSAAPVTTPSTYNEAGTAKPAVEFEDSEPIGAATKDTASSSVVVPQSSSAPKESATSGISSGAPEASGVSSGTTGLASGTTTEATEPTKATSSASTVPATSSATPVTSSVPTTSPSAVAPAAKTEPAAVPTPHSVPTGSSVPSGSSASKTESGTKADAPSSTNRSVEAAAPGAGLGATAGGLGARLGADADRASAKKPVDTTSASKSDSTVPKAGTTSAPAEATPTTASTTPAIAGVTSATAAPTSATAGTTAKTDTTSKPAAETGVSNVKEVSPVPSNGVTESSKPGKETVKLPTGDVVSAAPGSTAPKSAAGATTSSQPVVSAFASPSSSPTGAKATEAAKEEVTGSSAAKDGREGVASSTAAKTTPLDKGKEVASPAGATTTTATGSAAAQEVKPTTGGTTAATKPATGGTEAAAKPATTAAGKQEKKKESGGCGCCVIS